MKIRIAYDPEWHLVRPYLRCGECEANTGAAAAPSRHAYGCGVPKRYARDRFAQSEWIHVVGPLLVEQLRAQGPDAVIAGITLVMVESQLSGVLENVHDA